MINKINYRGEDGKIKKTIKFMNIALEQYELPFKILDKRSKSKRYWQVINNNGDNFWV